MILNGVLLIDKPEGITSHDVVYKARKILNMKAIGHAGTLDPFATGLLVLLLGEGTKISNFMTNEDKGYRVKAELGYTTDSWDKTGEKVKSYDLSKLNLEPEYLKNKVLQFQGDLKLKVPIFSAIKKDGKKLYEYARSNEKVETPLRNMNIYNLNWVEGGRDFFEVDFLCSKGTYVRSWVNEIGEMMGSGATAVSLKRTSSGPFELKESITLNELDQLKSKHSDKASFYKALKQGPHFKSLLNALFYMKSVRALGKEALLLKNGQISYSLQNRLIDDQRKAQDSEKSNYIKVLSNNDELMAILEIPTKGRVKIKRVFQS